MAKYKMKVFGACVGAKTGREYSVSPGDVIDNVPEGEFNERFGELVKPRGRSGSRKKSE